MSGRITDVVRSSCRGCHGVCQVLVHMEGDKVVKVSGDPDSPTSRGFLCPKGAAAPEMLYHPDRLQHPLRRTGARGENKWERVSWDEAIAEMVERFELIRREPGSEYLAVAQGTGRPYTEFTIRFANAFGTPNFVNPGHLCYIPRVIGSAITLGGLPVSDIYGFGGKTPACILNWGCNHVETGASDGMCGSMFKRAVKKAEKLIVVDPRRISLAKEADHWLQLRPGSECALALAMIHTIITEDLYDHEFVGKYSFGFDRLAEHIRPFTPEWADPVTRVPADQIRAAARTYATTRPASLQWGNGIDTSVNGFQTGRALLILMGLTGNIDIPGGDVLWIPPKGVKPKSPLVDMSVAGVQFLPPEKKARIITGGKYPFAPNCHPPTFWKSVVTGDPYRVRGIWIIGSNPIVTGTQGLTVERALRDHMEYTVVSDLFMTPTAQLADLVLPAAHWLEQDDLVCMHKIWCVLARKKLAQVGETRDDRDVIFDVAHGLGLNAAFPWPDRHAYLNWLLEDTGMSFEEFQKKEILMGEMRYRKYETEGFHTPSGKFELYSNVMEHEGRPPLPVYVEPPLSPVSTPWLFKEYPFILMSGTKMREFFHSEMHQVASLRRRHPDPVVEIHPDSAANLGIEEGDWVYLESPHGQAKFKARLFEGIAPDVVNAEHAWWYPEAPAPDYRWKESCANLLYGDEHFDPDTGAEPLKCYICKVYKA
ncbi:MAG: molybdopterin-dependent oxidoreductase [Deltaproteobacteria bacterium]|nr:molybdopterin-dependent oxidoreductase [Deltaproteobacteria bacterium]